MISNKSKSKKAANTKSKSKLGMNELSLDPVTAAPAEDEGPISSRLKNRSKKK